MKNKILIILVCIFMIVPMLFSEDNDKEFILSAMTFPEPVMTIGNLINDSMFALNLLNKNNNPEMLKKMIIKAEKEAGRYSVPEELYKLGNLYKDIYDYDNAVKKYKLCLNAFDRSGIDSPDFYKELAIKGYIYYYLAETDNKSGRIGYLEKASEFFKTAIGLKPDKDLWIKLGDSYLVSGRTTDALYCYKHVLEKEGNINYIYAKIQAATFQVDYLKLSENITWQKIKDLPVSQLTDFEYIQTAINNSSGRDKDILKVQHYVYLMRLFLLKSEVYRMDNITADRNPANIFAGDEKIIIEEAENYIKSAGKKCLRPASYNYVMGIVYYLKSDFKNTVLFFQESIRESEYPELIYKELISAVSGRMNDDILLKKIISDKIKKYPEASDYLILGSMEFKKNNLLQAGMLCNQGLKINNNYIEAFSALAVIFARSGNYFAADEMIKKGKYSSEINNGINSLLKKQIVINEAAIALLKNENERAYILLRSVLTADNDEKANKLYSRFLKKDGKNHN